MNKKESDSSITKKINDQHCFHIDIVKKLHKSGVNIICGTDAGVLNTAAGFSIHQELQFYKEAGMSNYEALQTATINPTKTHRHFDKFGTIEIDKYANLILTDENPLEDISVLKNPKLVFIKGRAIDQPLMQSFKRKAYDRQNFSATLVRFVKYILWDK
jgi:imidazolonepropionase-like amidohydrolase